MKVDHRHCLATPASKWRCVVLNEREEMMRLSTINEEPGAPGFDPRPACAGRSLVQRMEDRLDELIVRLMVASARQPQEIVMSEHNELVGLKGQALGLSECIALVRFPYQSTEEGVNQVKAAAMARYQATIAQVAS